jgi:predicted restriction endonuclease
MSEPKSSNKKSHLIEDIISVEDILLEYIISSGWKDYCKFARKLTEKIVEEQPSTQASLEKLVTDFTNPFFVYNDITKQRFVSKFPFKELLRQARIPRQIQPSNSKTPKTASKRKALSKRLRLLILERDGYKCCLCGRTAEEVKLEVDHKIPVSKGGTDSINNLRTLCIDCNRGKSDLNV